MVSDFLMMESRWEIHLKLMKTAFIYQYLQDLRFPLMVWGILLLHGIILLQGLLILIYMHNGMPAMAHP